MAMKGIILAAGKGSRLDGVCGNDPKCLGKVGELTLIERQIQALKASGIDEIIAVTGYKADYVRRVCGSDLEFIDNTLFDQTGSLYSLWLARHRLSEGFVV